MSTNNGKLVRSNKRISKAAEDLPDFSNGEEFDALSAVDKEKVARFYEEGRHRSEMRPLNAKERAEVKKGKEAAGPTKDWQGNQGYFLKRREGSAEPGRCLCKGAWTQTRGPGRPRAGHDNAAEFRQSLSHDMLLMLFVTACETPSRRYTSRRLNLLYE